MEYQETHTGKSFPELLKAQRRVKGWIDFEVVRVREDTPDTKTFFLQELSARQRRFDYFAGQYLTFRIDGIQEKPVVRSYTMSSAPSMDEVVAVTIKRVQGGLVSNWFCDSVIEGSTLRGRGPIGRFCLEAFEYPRPLKILTAGSGVTPFLSILREHYLGEDSFFRPPSVELLVAFRSEQDIIWSETLKALAHEPGVRIKIALTRENMTAKGYGFGRPDEAMVREFMELSSEALYMTCGPKALMDQFVAIATDQGVPKEQIMLEAFD